MTRFAVLLEKFPEQFFLDEPLARYTVARLGGKADGLLRVKTVEELCFALRWAFEAGIPWLILGGGANVLASDNGFRGLVIVNHARDSQIDAESGKVTAESGVSLSTLARMCMAQGLKNLEWGVNVPGTVGGAVVNNAGAHGGDMAHCLIDVEIFNVPENRIETWSAADMHYDYRYSSLKGQHGHYGVLRASLQLESGHEPAELNRIADEFVAHRKRTQPPGASLGSMFKNPPGDYAGRLIEAAGLKGTQIGGVQISPLHANFFINLGGGTAADYHALIDLARRAVREKLGIELELEIELIGDSSRTEDEC